MDKNKVRCFVEEYFEEIYVSDEMMNTSRTVKL